MAKSLVCQLTITSEGRRLYQQERTILECTELICKVMDENGVTRAELARRLGKSKGYVTKLLDGQIDMSIRVISDIFTVLGKSLCLSIVEMNQE